MGQSIDNMLKIQFGDMVHIKAQQIKARMKPYVQILKMSGDKFAYDGIGDVEATEIKGRIQPVVFQDIEHLRRKISRRRFAITLPVDDSDIRGSLLDPKGLYAKSIVAGLERRFDRLVVEAMFADVWTGRDFETQLTAEEDGVKTVDATSGLTYEKLLEIQQNWIDADVGTDMPVKKVIGITGEEHTALMNDTQLTNGDYSRQYVVDKGEITSAVGLDVIKFAGEARNPIISVGTDSVRHCFAATTEGIAVGVSVVKLDIKERNDYYETTQVQAILEMGAVRTEGVQVQEILTTKAA